jgi:SGNH domain (fused to AT3 domains)
MAATPSSSLGVDQATVDKIVDTAIADTSGGAGAAGLPQTVDRPVPAALRPSIDDARQGPLPSEDGCNVSWTDVDSPSCTYGDVNGAHTIVLFGDSKADQWFPALQKLSIEHGWRLIVYVKSSCRVADITEWSTELKRVYTECTTWREHTLPRIASLHPDLVVVANLDRPPMVRPDGSRYSGDAGLPAYEAGLARTLETLSHSAGHVLMLGDTPEMEYDVPVCLSAHMSSIRACSTPVSMTFSPAWHKATQDAASQAGAAYVDTTFWVCSSSPCPPIVGDFLIYRDAGHLTPPFAEALTKYLGRSLPGFPQDAPTGGAPQPSPSRSPSLPPAAMREAPTVAPAGRRRFHGLWVDVSAASHRRGRPD